MATEQDKREAEELAARAKAQGRNAVKNTARAAKAGAPVAADAAVDAASAAAEIVGDVAEEVNDAAEEAADAVKETARRVSPKVLSRLTGDVGIGFLALSVSIYSGVIAYNQFAGVFSQRNSVVRPPTP